MRTRTLIAALLMVLASMFVAPSAQAYVTHHEKHCKSWDPAGIWGGDVRVCVRWYSHAAPGGWLSSTRLEVWGERQFLDGPHPFRDINVYSDSRTHGWRVLGDGRNPANKHFRMLTKGRRALITVLMNVRTQSAPDIRPARWRFHVCRHGGC